MLDSAKGNRLLDGAIQRLIKLGHQLSLPMAKWLYYFATIAVKWRY